MTGDGSMIVSPEALTRLKEALLRYRTRTNTMMSEVTSDLSRRLKRLEVARDEAQREVRRFQRDLSDCDEDDDSGQAQSDLDAAEERLKRIDHWIGQVVDALPQFKRANQGAQTLVTRLPRTVSFLEGKLTQFMDYANVQMPKYSARGGNSTTAGPSATAIVGDVTSDHLKNLPDVALPAGYQWVKLDAISRRDDLRPDESFHKASEEDVKKGFYLLKNEILPALDEDRTLPSDHFGNLDRGAGRSYAEGIQRVYDAFFGGDCIALDRGLGDGKYGVTNGRHRLHIARDLGWEAVPVKIL